MYLLSCKYTKLTWTQPKPGWAFCFLAWEADTHFSHDAAEDWTVTEISLCLQSNMLGRCPEERLHWAVLLIPQGGARSVHLSRCFMMKISSCSCLVSLAWWSAGDEASSLSLLVSPGLWEEAAGWESCLSWRLSLWRFSSRDWIHVSLVHHWKHAPLKHSGLAGFQTHYNMSLRG